MSQIFSDNFNSYTDRDLTGQGSWTGSAIFDVQGTTVQEGAKAVQATVGALSASISKSGTLTSDGDLIIYMRVSGLSSDQRWYLQLLEGGSFRYEIRLYWDANKIQTYSGGWINVGDWIANTWHKIRVQWRSSDKWHRISVDDGAFSSWMAGETSFTSGIDILQLSISSDSATSRDYFVDNIGPTTATTNSILFSNNY